jgi:riboflavin kinase/FMN adenylyltransferase
MHFGQLPDKPEFSEQVMLMKEKTIYALGFFDGVHLGHQALLKSCRELARERGCKAGAITFNIHPQTLTMQGAPKLINTARDRRMLLTGCGMDSVVELDFDEKLMHTHWSSFLQQLVEAGAEGFVCGSDFRFGAGGLGTAKKLEAFCKRRELLCAVVPQQFLDGIRISSTYIRQLLAEGDLERATDFLGHQYVLTGTVVSGRKIGQTIGVPTANIHVPENVLLPRSGVYACKTCVDGKAYLAVTNIGSRPTVGGHHITVEPWLLDFEGDLYGKELTLAFYKFLRPEQKFESLAQLQHEIQKNAGQTREFFEK